MGVINDFMSISPIEGWGPPLSCLALNPQHPATEPTEEMCNQQVNEKREEKTLMEFRALVPTAPWGLISLLLLYL